MKDVKVKVEFTNGYEKRYTEAVLRAYEKKAQREKMAERKVYPQEMAECQRWKNKKEKGEHQHED